MKPNDEFLEAAIWWHSNLSPDFFGQSWEDAVRYGFALAQPDGADQVAPIWLQKYREEMRRFEP